MLRNAEAKRGRVATSARLSRALVAGKPTLDALRLTLRAPLPMLTASI